MNNNEFCGFLLINKAPGMSSFDCIRKIKKLLPKKTKIGHTGTLDEFAEGLLIICIKREATKLITNLINFDKQYIVKAKLGELTNTLDHTGETIQKNDLKITKDELLDSINQIGKEYEQTPPIFSALKFQGKPLYKLARKNQKSTEDFNQILESKKRIIKIYNLEILEFNYPFYTFKADVSKGTYIRSLANDIAKNLNSFATTYYLQRTHIGNFKLENAINIDSINSTEDINKNLHDISELKNS